MGSLSKLYRAKLNNFKPYSRLLLFGLLCSLICVYGVSCQSPVTKRSEPFAENKLGMHLLLEDGRNHWPTSLWAEHMQYARQIAGEWGYVTQLIALDDLDMVKWQYFMDLCADLQLTPILRLATTFDRDNNYWTAPPIDENGRFHTIAEEYANFLTALEWPTDTHYVIVGNEPNHGNEWQGKPDPAGYARFLVDVATAIHAADPQAYVLNAGFDNYTPHTGIQPFADGFWYMDTESFMDGMIMAEPDVFAHLDGWSSHPYPMGPFIAPPWEQTFQIDWLNDAQNPNHHPPPADMVNRGVNSYEWELWLLGVYGFAPLPVFITETGWRHTLEPYPDVEVVADYFDLALFGNENGRFPNYPQNGWIPWQNDPQVVAVTPFALNGEPFEWAHTNWLSLSSDGQVIHPGDSIFSAFHPQK